MAAPLFSPSLLPASVSSSLPPGYVLRPLQKSDHDQFLAVLRVLTAVGEISSEAWSSRYDWMAARSDEYFIVVIEDDGGRVADVGSLIVEGKFIHDCGLVGHVEDIAVLPDQQGKKLGLKVIQALDGIAEKVGCYKSILDCSEKNQGFYEKCGFKLVGLEMAHYYEVK